MSDPFDFIAAVPGALSGSLTLEDLSVASERVWQRGWDAAAQHLSAIAAQGEERTANAESERLRDARSVAREEATHRAVEEVREILMGKPAYRVDIAIRKTIEGLPKNASAVLRNELEALRIQAEALTSVLNSVEAWAGGQ